MAAKSKDEPFVVSDRRKFTSEGEIRPDAETSRNEAPAAAVSIATSATPSPEVIAHTESNLSPDLSLGDAGETAEMEAPTPEEQRHQEDAYRRSTSAMDITMQKEMASSPAREAEEHGPPNFEMTFERLIASLYMTAMLQLGMARPEGGEMQPDIAGARQTIDTLALLHGKTKGNLTKQEENLLQNCLFELRMAYIEITNRIVQPTPGIRVPDAK